MRLDCQKTFLILVVSVVACTSTSGPEAITARFELSNIDGRPLPTPPAFTPGLTPTILSGTVLLDSYGQALFTEHRTEWNGADVTSTTNYTYSITDSHIQFEPTVPCPANAICAAPPSGTILFGTRLSLDMGRVNSDIIHYNYVLSPIN